MTITNWIGIGITILILIVGGILYAYFRKRLNDIDGFEGFETDEDILKENNDHFANKNSNEDN